MRRKNLAGKQVLFTTLITIFILQSASVNAENNNLQDNNNFNENRVLSFEKPTLYMFGEQTTGPVNEWKTWNHANNLDESALITHFLKMLGNLRVK